MTCNWFWCVFLYATPQDGWNQSHFITPVSTLERERFKSHPSLSTANQQMSPVMQSGQTGRVKGTCCPMFLTQKASQCGIIPFKTAQAVAPWCLSKVLHVLWVLPGLLVQSEILNEWSWTLLPTIVLFKATPGLGGDCGVASWNVGTWQHKQ